jgi:hypothetical protein
MAVSAVTVLFAGCDTAPHIASPITNQPPTVRLTAAPVSELKSDSVFYAYRINWVGYDPDGRVDHFLYAIDPPSVDRVDSTWTQTRLNQFLLFRARNPDNINTTGGSSTADESAYSDRRGRQPKYVDADLARSSPHHRPGVRR